MYTYWFAVFLRISSRDTGKTMVDASLGEIMTTCEKITWLLSEGEKWLKPEYRYFHHVMFLLFNVKLFLSKFQNPFHCVCVFICLLLHLNDVSWSQCFCQYYLILNIEVYFPSTVEMSNVFKHLPDYLVLHTIQNLMSINAAL